jgi:hypothetical protein
MGKVEHGGGGMKAGRDFFRAKNFFC